MIILIWTPILNSIPYMEPIYDTTGCMRLTTATTLEAL